MCRKMQSGRENSHIHVHFFVFCFSIFSSVYVFFCFHKKLLILHWITFCAVLLCVEFFASCTFSYLYLFFPISCFFFYYFLFAAHFFVAFCFFIHVFWLLLLHNSQFSVRFLFFFLQNYKKCFSFPFQHRCCWYTFHLQETVMK